jgi:hypothetical protein
MTAGERIAELERELQALRSAEPREIHDSTKHDSTADDSTAPDSTAPERRDWRFWRHKP